MAMKKLCLVFVMIALLLCACTPTEDTANSDVGGAASEQGTVTDASSESEEEMQSKPGIELPDDEF